MAPLFKFMLAAVLVAVTVAVQTPVVVIVPPINDVLDDKFYGLDDPEDSAVLNDNDSPTPADPSVGGGDEIEGMTTTLSSARGGRGRHGGRGHHGGRGRHGHHGRRPDIGAWTPEQKIAHVCSKIASSSSNRAWWERKMNRKLERLTPDVRRTVTTVIATRKQEMAVCCQKPETERVQCAETMSNRRYDRVCNNEEPLCVWALMKGGSTSSSSDTVSRCCASHGADRYACFTEARNTWQSQRSQRRSP